jgi:hypothetical protein
MRLQGMQRQEAKRSRSHRNGRLRRPSEFRRLLYESLEERRLLASSAIQDQGSHESASGSPSAAHPPVAVADAYAMYGQTLTITGSGVLQNDSDVDGDALTAFLVDPPSHGVLTLNPDGSFAYEAGPGFGGKDAFTYVASDGVLESEPATVTITHMLYVRNTNNSGEGSLRWAMTNANAHPGRDTIQFAIPGEGVHTIRPSSALPTITDPVVLDATTQPGYAHAPLIELDGSMAGAAAAGFVVESGASVIRGFVINRFGAQGILLCFGGDNVIQANYIGTDRTGSHAAENGWSGATTGHGIYISGGSSRNLIGTDGDGVNDQFEGNLVSGNRFNGIAIFGLVADSQMQFSGIQGKNNWYYGYYGGDGPEPYRPSDFEECLQFDGTKWWVNSGLYWTSLWAHAVHPNARTTSAGRVSAEHWPTRRWISDVSGTLEITGTLRKEDTNSAGDGVTGYIFLDGEEVWSQYLAATNGVGVNYTIDVVVNPGSVIDFALAPGRTSWADGTAFTTKIYAKGSVSGDLTNNVIAGNFIGTNAQGTASVANGAAGIVIGGASSNDRIGTNGDGVSDSLERNVISGNAVQGVLIFQAAARNVVAGNFIGTDVTGNIPLANGRHGIELHSGASWNTIGTNGDGLGDLWEGNVISGNGALGVRISGIATDNNIVAGNLVGTNLQGTHAVANAEQGILITGSAKRNIIGTNGDGISDAEESNLVSGNVLDGIGIRGSGVDSNIVAGNLVGTDISGGTAIANGHHGISVWAGAKSNRVGTNGDGISDAWERNIVSGNAWSGINLERVGTDGNVVAGNYIGTDVTSQRPVPNRQSGVRVADWAQGNWIGTNGDGQGDAVEGNVISGNMLVGVLISGQGTDRNRIAGNLIGTASCGLTAVPNQSHGVRIETGASENVIGTDGDGVSDSLEGNTISGNIGMGIIVGAPGTDGNVIAGNVIGLDRTGKIAVANQWHGIKVQRGAQYTRIGTNGDGISDREEANIISANASNGILFQFEGTSHNLVAGNFIGTDASGTIALGNNRNGIAVADGAQNILGGSGSLANTIAFNASSGVRLFVSPSHGVSIRGNSIYLNGGLGIDLGSAGPTWNDPGDVDLGPNHLQNFPVLSTVSPGTTTLVSGTLDSVPLNSFTLDFYANTELDPSGFGEGERYLGAATVTTDADGLAVFHVALAAATAPGEFVTATATASDGSTSEFSRGVVADGLPDLRIDASGIVVAPFHPAAGESVAIAAPIVNQGLVDAASVRVRFYDLDALIDEVTIPAIAAGSAELATVETSFPNDSYRLITVVVDPLNAILELDEGNNQASTILQVGLPSTEDATLGIEMGTFSGCAGRGVSIHGSAFYDFEQLPGERDFPVQGGRVTVSLADPDTGQVLARFAGAHTDVSGDFRQGILAPQEAGLYTVVTEITDGTIQAAYTSTLSVSACPTTPPITPPALPLLPPGEQGGSLPSETLTDVFIVSEGIIFSNDHPELGEEISIFGFVQYIGPDAVENVPVTIVSRFPLGGQLREFPIARTVVDFPASPATATYIVVEAAWTGTARGDHVIQVAAEPSFPQNTGNDAATRVIVVGSVMDGLAFVKTVELLVDADGDSRPSAGDTLRYVLTFQNAGAGAVTSARIVDDYDQRLLLTPAQITHDGSADDDTIVWNLGTIQAGAQGAVAYEATLKPLSQFPGGFTRVDNTAYFYADQISPVVATAQIEVWGDHTPPITIATVTPSANMAGWNNTDVQVLLRATDPVGGAGVREIIYSVDDGPDLVVAGDSAELTIDQEGIYTIRFRAVDRASNAEDVKSLTLRIDKTAPVAVHDGPFIVYEGDLIFLDGSGSYDALSGILTTAWSLDGDGVFDSADPAAFEGYDGPATFAVQLQVVDVAGNETITETTVVVLNAAPIITVDSANVVVDESQTAHNTGTFADPGLDKVTLTASVGTVVDNGDGTWIWSFDTVDGPDDNQTVVVTATDNDGAASSVEFELTVHNVSPSIVALSRLVTSCGGLAEGRFGEIFTVEFADPGVLDHHTVLVDWGDGSPPQELPVSLGDRALTAGHQYEDGGIYQVTVQVMDDDGGSSQQVSTIALVTGIGALDGVLQIIGTEQNDRVMVNQQGNGLFKVHANFLPGANFKTFPAAEIERIYIVLCDGDDHASIAGSLRIPAIIDGGPGDDHLIGGGGGNVILGGPGDDHIVGGGVRDILIGGSGEDRIVANGGEDILIGGRTVYDSDWSKGQPANDAALLTLLEHWNSEDSFADRVAALSSDEEAYRLVPQDTVLDDEEVDMLIGSADENWILGGSEDILPGLLRGEPFGKK